MVVGEAYGCVKSFCCLGVTLDGNGGADLAASARIINGWMKFRAFLPFLTSRAPPLEMKGRVYASCVRSNMIYGSTTRLLLSDVGLTFERAEMQMIRLMCGVSIKDRRTSEELRRLVGVQHITTVIGSGRLRWYNDEDWVKKCVEFRVEGRRPVGRPRSVEADMECVKLFNMLFMKIYVCQKIQIRCNNLLASKYNISNGVKQGGCLSPI